MKTVKRHWSIRILEGVLFVFLIIVLFYTVFQKNSKKGDTFDESEYADGIFYADSLLKASHNKAITGDFDEAKKMNEEAAQFYKKSLEQLSMVLQNISVDNDPRQYIRMKDREASYNFKLFLGTYENKYSNKAILAYKEVLQHTDKDKYPSKYANLQYQLGNCYMFWQNDDKEERFGNAVKAYLEAGKVLPKETDLAKYGQIFYNLGYAYSLLADKNDADYLLKSLNAYQTALEIFTTDSFPERYATIKYRQGFLYYRLSKLREQKDNLQKALIEFEEALKIRTPEKNPLAHAETKDIIGVVYEDLSKFGDKNEYLSKSIEVRREALKVYVEQPDAANRFTFQLTYLPLKIKKLEERLK